MKSYPALWHILGFAAILGVAADILFYPGKPVGISVLIFAILVLCTLFFVGWRAKVRPVARNLWLAVALLFEAAMVLVRANGVLTVLNMVAVIGLCMLLLFFYATDHVGRLTLLDYPVVLGLIGKEMVVRPLPLAGDGVRLAIAHRHQAHRFVPMLRGLAIALPVLLIFTFLLTSADTIFAKYVADLTNFRFLNQAPDALLQVCIVLFVGWIVAGGLLFSLSRKHGSEAGNARTALPGLMALNRRLGLTETAIVLSLVNLLFLAFAVIQFTFLFSGQAASTMNYAVYREYVHQGFGQLLVAVFLTLLLILGLRWAAHLDNPGQRTVFNLLSTLMLGLAGVMLVSAIARMLTWENVEYYISTDTRVYIRAFLIWLSFSFVWLVITLWTRPDRFAIGFFIAVLGWLVTINLMNPDADVAAYNLARYSASQNELSTYYLYTLSDDAVPVLVQSLHQTTGVVQQSIREDLGLRYGYMLQDTTWQNWPAFNLARAQAYDLLSQLHARGEITPLRNDSGMP